MRALDSRVDALVRAQELLARRPAAEVASRLGALSRRWLDPRFRYRVQAERRLARSGFAPKAAGRMLTELFRELTAPKLSALLRAELGDPGVLDGFRGPLRRRRAAHGPGLICHIFPGNMPQPGVQGTVFGLLLKSANLAKVSRRDPGILDLYLSSLKRHDTGLAACCRITEEDPSPLYARAGLVAVWGQDETLRRVRAQVPPSVPFVGYGHRISFGWIAKGSLSTAAAPRLARAAALDVWLSDQRGCLSPVVVYAQAGGEVTPERFAEMIAQTFSRLEGKRRDLLTRAAAQEGLKSAHLLRNLRGGAGPRFWESRPRGQWIVLYDRSVADLPLSGGHQSLHVKRFSKDEQVYEALRPYARHLQAAAVEAPAASRQGIARRLSAMGVTRICRAGGMQTPPLLWYHDGRPNLSGWLRWTELEP